MNAPTQEHALIGTTTAEANVQLVSTKFGSPTKEKALTAATDRFAKLPPEIREKVLTLLPDLPALQSLIYASDTCKATFEQNPVKIANIIMSGLTLELRQLMRAVAVALTGCNDDRLIGGFLFHNIRIFAGNEFDHVDEEFGRPTLPAALPLPPIQKFLLVSCFIQKRGNEFLETYIDRLYRIEAKHLVDEEYIFPLGQLLEDHPPGIGFCPQMTRSVSWIERYRVECTLWRLQLLANFGQYDGKVHVTNRSWVDQGLYTYTSFARMWESWTYWEKDQMQTVHFHFEKRQMALYHESLEGLEREFWSPKAKLAFTSSGVLANQPALDNPPTDDLARAWDQDRFAARRETRSGRFYGQSYLFRGSGVDWKVFRELGFGFWDLRRMCEMELFSDKLHVCDPPDDVGHPAGDRHALRKGVGVRIKTEDNAFFTWMSIKLDGKRIVSDAGNQDNAP